MELEVLADPEPDELGRVELRGHVALLEPEQPRVEPARHLVAAPRHRHRYVLEGDRHERQVYFASFSIVIRSRQPLPTCWTRCAPKLGGRAPRRAHSPTTASRQRPTRPPASPPPRGTA